MMWSPNAMALTPWTACTGEPHGSRQWYQATATLLPLRRHKSWRAVVGARPSSLRHPSLSLAATAVQRHTDLLVVVSVEQHPSTSCTRARCQPTSAARCQLGSQLVSWGGLGVQKQGLVVYQYPIAHCSTYSGYLLQDEEVHMSGGGFTSIPRPWCWQSRCLVMAKVEGHLGRPSTEQTLFHSRRFQRRRSAGTLRAPPQASAKQGGGMSELTKASSPKVTDPLHSQQHGSSSSSGSHSRTSSSSSLLRAGAARSIYPLSDTLRLISQADLAQAVREAAAAASPTTQQPQLGMEAAPLLPKLLLLLTAVLWGSLPPTMRLLYSSPGPPDPVVVVAVKTGLQAVAYVGLMRLPASLLMPLGLGSAGQRGSSSDGRAGDSGSSHDSSSSSPGLSNGSSSGSSIPARVPPAVDAGEAAAEGGWVRRWLGQQSPTLWVAALELGLLNYLAAATQTFGLQLTGATRAGFLIQAKSLFTPLLAALAGYATTGRVWAGCGLALAGTLLIAADGAQGAAAGGMAEGLLVGGDTAILTAALFYSLATVRTPGYSKPLPTLDLAAGKSLALAGAALLSLLVVAAGTARQGQRLSGLWEGWADPAAWAVLAYLAAGPGVLGSYLQVRGLRDVPPGEAQVIFSTTPLWAAAFSWVLLGGEQLGALTWAGGASIVVAGLLASTGAASQRGRGEGKRV